MTSTKGNLLKRKNSYQYVLRYTRYLLDFPTLSPENFRSGIPLTLDLFAIRRNFSLSWAADISPMIALKIESRNDPITTFETDILLSHLGLNVKMMPF